MAQASVLRLKSRSQFQAVLREGSVVARSAHFALHRLSLHFNPNDGQVAVQTVDAARGAADAADGAQAAAGPGSDGPQALFAVKDVWIGAMVPKRWARRAVTRNLIKRQIYAVCQLNATRFGQAAHVLRLRGSFDRQSFVSAASDQLRIAVREELSGLLSKVR